MTALGKLATGVRTVMSDIAQGFFEITHNGMALVGLATVFAVLTLLALTAVTVLMARGSYNPFIYFNF